MKLKERMKGEQKTNQGITLIALVVTLVILIILATISVSALFGENGLITKAREAKEQQTIAEYMDKLALAEATTAVKNQGKVNQDLFVETVKEEGIIAETNIEKNTENNYEMTANEGYVFTVITKGENDIEVIYQGKDGEVFVPVESIALSQTTVEMTEGEEITLTATITPDNATNKVLTWESGQPSVATVDNGKVTALQVGSTTITAKATDGSEKTATCTITVNAKISEVTPDTPVGTEVLPPSRWTSDKVTAISDGSGNAIPLPDGFYYIGGDRNTGLVISDRQGDTLTSSYPNSGNQFVWIPVDSESDLERANFELTGIDVVDCFEPYEDGYSGGNGIQEIADFNTMKTQVLKYGGFYMGRYEAGDGTNGSSLRTDSTDAHTVLSQKGVAPYNHIPWGLGMDDISEIPGSSGAVYLASNMYNGKEQSNSVITTLCYGSQWDAMCRYIEDNDRTISANGKVKLTGSADKDVSKNIYDLAGNCKEWTMEAYGYPYNERILRGGFFNHVASVGARDSFLPSVSKR